MTTASQRGKQNRGKGSRWERDVARYLRDTTGIDVVTTRDLAAGRRTGADLGTVLARDERNRVVSSILDVEGWSLECKDDESTSLPAMMRQAKADADNDLYAVILKRRRCPVATAYVHMPLAALCWWATARSLTADHPHREATVTVDLELFAKLLVFGFGGVMDLGAAS